MLRVRWKCCSLECHIFCFYYIYMTLSSSARCRSRRRRRLNCFAGHLIEIYDAKNVNLITAVSLTTHLTNEHFLTGL